MINKTMWICPRGCSPQIDTSVDKKCICFYCKSEFIQTEIPEETLIFLKETELKLNDK